MSEIKNFLFQNIWKNISAMQRFLFGGWCLKWTKSVSTKVLADKYLAVQQQYQAFDSSKVDESQSNFVKCNRLHLTVYSQKNANTAVGSNFQLWCYPVKSSYLKCSRKLKRKEKVIHILIKVKAPCMLLADLCTEWKDMNILHFLNIPTICCSILTISNKFEFNLTETETFIWHLWFNLQFKAPTPCSC